MQIGIALPIALALTLPLSAQVNTEVPAVVPGAKPVTVEHIKIHGSALEGNLEGDDVDRDVIVFLPPSYATQKTRRYPVVYALHGYSIGAEQWTQRDPCAANHRRRLRAGRSGHDCGAARFQDRAQRIDVLQFRHHRRL